mgnify:CR=1 FL=1
MNKKVILFLGLFIFGVYMVIDKLITPISVWIAVPVLIISVIMILYGGLKPKSTVDKN